MKILVTGGCGYIGSHTCVELLKSGYEVVIVDNLCNSKAIVVDRIREITGKDVIFYEEDVCNYDKLDYIFTKEKIDAVIHFAGLKAVGESCSIPLKYYRNNIDSTLTLCEVMDKHDVRRLVFSSSATVYGKPKELPIREDFPLSVTNPYGATKLMIESILKDLYLSNNSWSIAVLRYFNPIGAHDSGLLGEDPNGIPNNLMPYIVKVATGELECLNVFGDDYDTKDGTGVRDYIHVVDLSIGHIKAVESVISTTGIDYYNLGTGHGYSVLDIINTFERVNNVKVNYRITSRRAGDIDACYADPTYALKKLNFRAERGLEDMCRDSYNYVLRSKRQDG